PGLRNGRADGTGSLSEGLSVRSSGCPGLPGNQGTQLPPFCCKAAAQRRSSTMFGDYSVGDLMSIMVMQGFAGLILFSVFVLMALGLAIIFGQMGVINMAHGEFMILGAYMTYLTSHIFQSYLPGLYAGYFFVAMAIAFVVSGALGML